ncbi:ly6/PLAUR domain-containing protein 6 isoform X2 [Mastacembelus armatus]|uniref:ly6/PLAUR domain-containing protein 6 isoform X2 n=1 Tax=Mastacembelus armatus TaxID=205130 RepID=UPI000E45A595|nr:ly6/PLAUR domain-containing protein 6 isoform X2 [Mastacembelus armatus]
MMEAWPTVAWLLLLTILADWLKTVQSRDFSIKDIILLHPSNTRYCYTLHMMDDHGDSVSVTKRCATLEDCLFTGCAHVTDHGSQVCSSCCEGNICNMLVPRNESSAVFSSTSPLVSSSGRPHPAALSCILFGSIFTAHHV